MFIDKPSPGIGFVILFILLIAVFIVIPAVTHRSHRLRPAWNTVVVVLSILMLAFLAFCLHAGFSTEYTVRDGLLNVKTGFLFKKEILLTEIRRIERVPVNWQMLGTAFQLKGYCNRFIDGVRLITDGEIIYLSPSDPEAFMRELAVRSKR